jgi:hypothetical protein
MRNMVISGFDAQTRQAFEAFCRENPASIVDEGVKWFKDRGIKVSRNAVWLYRKKLTAKRTAQHRIVDLAVALRSMGGGFFLRVIEKDGALVIEVHEAVDSHRKQNPKRLRSEPSS